MRKAHSIKSLVQIESAGSVMNGNVMFTVM